MCASTKRVDGNKKRNHCAKWMLGTLSKSFQSYFESIKNVSDWGEGTSREHTLYALSTMPLIVSARLPLPSKEVQECVKNRLRVAYLYVTCDEAPPCARASAKVDALQ